MQNKPTILGVVPNKIPTELKSIPRWVMWRMVPQSKQNGDIVWKKVPYQTDGKMAKSTAAATWTTYEDAMDAYLMGGFDGIGITIDGSDDFQGIDLDDCIIDGELNRDATEVLGRIDGYAEISPSGKGIKLFTRSNLAISGKKGNIEVYRDGRYFTVTGHTINGHGCLPETIQDIDWFVERHFGSNNQISSLETYKPTLTGWDIDKVSNELIPFLGNIDNYEDWLQLGMALHHQGSGDSKWMEVWDEVSRGTSTYNRQELESKWDSFSEQRNTGAGAITLASIIKNASDFKKAEQTKTFERYETLIKDCNDINDLRTTVVEAIKAELGIDHISRGVLAHILKDKFKEFKFPVSIGDAKNLIKPKGRDGVPDWAADWVYVTHEDRFFNIVTKRKVTQSGFGAMFNRLTGDDSAATLALDLWGIPTPDKIIYLPAAEDLFEMNGVPCVNEYNKNSPPDIPVVFSKGDLEAIKVVQTHLAMILTEPGAAAIMTSWMAYCVQNPGVKIRWAPLIKGIEGDGKSVLGNLMMGVMGMANVGIVSPSVLATGFTSWAAGRCVNVLEEIRMVGHNRHDVLNTIKPYITNDQVTIHPKGVNEFVAPNTVNYIAFTNHHDALPLEDTDRRWWVQFTPFNDQEELARVADSDYFSRLFESIANYAPGLRKWLLEYIPVDAFNPKGQAPNSFAKNQMIGLNTSDEFEIIKTLLEEGGPGFSKEIFSSKHLTTAMGFIEDVEVPKGKALNKMLMKLGYMKMDKAVKWKGSMCQIWFKKIAFKDLLKMDADEINVAVRQKLEETNEKDILE